MTPNQNTLTVDRAADVLASATRTRRIDRLREQIAEGSYVVDPETVAGAILARRELVMNVERRLRAEL